MILCVYACHPHDSPHLLDHHGALLTQIGALVDLQNELQSTYMSTNQSNQFWLRIFWLFQNPWRFWRIYNNENCSNFDFQQPQIFLDFSSLYIYFCGTEIHFQEFLKMEESVDMWGLHACLSSAAHCFVIGSLGWWCPGIVLSWV
jgi:hypothetical protein